MKINSFFDDYQGNTHYDYKILLYGNYTYRKNLEADSYIQVLRHLIPYMSQRWKIHFTIPIPEFVGSLNFPNVEQVIYELPTYINQMRTHFDSKKFMDIIDWKMNDWDIIYTHLPEHTKQIANCIYNNTNIFPKIIGYSHWYEVSQNTSYEKNMFDVNVAGMLEMEECGVNSNWLKELVIKNASKKWNSDSLEKLDKIIQPHYLGVDRVNPRTTYKDKTVIFNHRGNGYTGWGWFSDIVDEIWETRKDFKVYTTLVDTAKDWNVKVNMTSREDYMNFLSEIKFGVGAFQTYSAWSISTTDGLSVGVPYLLPNSLCYPEMVNILKEPYPYLYNDRNDFIKKFNEMLDNPITYDTTKLAETMGWEKQISKWFSGWTNVFDFKSISKETDSILKIISFIKDNKFVTKFQILEHLGWGVRIKWNGYRNYLRTIPEIRFTKTGYEWVG